MDISLSGLQAAQTRLAVSANNVANTNTSSTVNSSGEQLTEAYSAQRVVQTSQQLGGTQAQVVDKNPATEQAFDLTQNAVVSFPNVDLADEAVSQIEAVNAYKANISVINTLSETEESLLDIVS